MTFWQFIFIAVFLFSGLIGVYIGCYVGFLIYKKDGQTFWEFLKDTFKKSS